LQFIPRRTNMTPLERLNICGAIQLVLTVASIFFGAFTICLLYQIQHEMASNPQRFQRRKMLLVTALVLQILTLTILRDQWVWNEDVADHAQVPNPEMCWISKILWYGILENVVYYLFVALLWEETESCIIIRKQLDPEFVEITKQTYADHFFYLLTIFTFYICVTAATTLVPYSMIPDATISGYFLDGVGDARCQMSFAANSIGITNKLLFLSLSFLSSIRFRKRESTHHIADTVTCFVVIPLCSIANIFALCNESWLSMLSLDNARTTGFISTVILSVSMVCTHIMMQAQAKQKIVSGVRRISDAARKSILGMSSNKIEIEPTEKKQRFSVPEIDVDGYDEVVIGPQEHNDIEVQAICVDDQADGQEVKRQSERASVANKGDGDNEKGLLEELNELSDQLKRDSIERMQNLDSVRC